MELIKNEKADIYNHNVQRDFKVRRQLRRMGWEVLVIWECELREPESTLEKVQFYLDKVTK